MTYRQLVGHRRDIDLSSRWWHRLFSVIYVCGFGITGVLALLIAWSSAQPDRTTGNITILASLTDVVARASPTENAAETLVKQPGYLGLRETDGRIGYLSDYGLANSYCARVPLEAAGLIAAHWNKQNFASAYSESDVLAALKNKWGDRPLQSCWFDKIISTEVDGRSWDDIIKYDFTATAVLRARIPYLGWTLLGLAVAHVLFMLMYHRGFVYVVYGPVRKAAGEESTDR